MNKILVGLTALLVLFIILPSRIEAADVLFFDSTNKYLGACQLTDKSEWSLTEEVKVTKFEVWYNWNQGETELPVKLFKDGKLFAEFNALRSSCDPYQQTWCNADYQINQIFTPGKYSTQIPNKRQCLKPGGTGAIRLYKDDSKTENVTATPTAVPTTPSVTTSATTAQLPQPSISPAIPPTPCSCNQTTLIVSAAAVSGVVSFAVSLLMKKIHL